MTTPDLKSAMERVRRVRNGENPHEVYRHELFGEDYHSPQVAYRNEKEKCLDAYLAANPADDGEEADCEWISKLPGAIPDDEDDGWKIEIPVHPDDAGHMRCWITFNPESVIHFGLRRHLIDSFNDSYFSNETEFPRDPTKGTVRSILRAYGITIPAKGAGE